MLSAHVITTSALRSTPEEITEAQLGLVRHANSAAAQHWSAASEAIRARSELFNYAHTRDTFTFERLKTELGYDQAVAFEIEYQGVEALELQSREALKQMNAILSALHRPVLLRWPTEKRVTCDVCDQSVPASQMKSTSGFNSFAEFAVDGPSCCLTCRGEAVEASDWTPVDEALGLPIFQNTDFWYCHFKRSADAVQLASDYPCCDVVDLETDTVISTNNALCRLDDSRYGNHEAFGVAFPETLNLFITDFVAGLYPGLEAK